jgi:hypothetical protein
MTASKQSHPDWKRVRLLISLKSKTNIDVAFLPRNLPDWALENHQTLLVRTVTFWSRKANPGIHHRRTGMIRPPDRGVRCGINAKARRASVS